MDLPDAAHDSPTAFARASAAAQYLRSIVSVPELAHPRTAIVCGSGLGGLQHALMKEPRIEVPYEKIAGMPKSTVQGHEGKMVFGMIGTEKEEVMRPVVLLVGRAHFYEGHSMDSVTFATRVCKCLGVETMIVTNAAGGLNPDYQVGDLVLLHDHLNIAGLVGVHPLRGPNEADFGVRFPPLSDAYDIELRRQVHQAWNSLTPSVIGTKTLHEGIYAFVSGPSYETRAECRMLRMLGADVVGMSTVPEVIVARHAGMKILAMSLVTNQAVLEEGVKGNDTRLTGMSAKQREEELGKGKANHEEVLEAGKQAAEVMQELIVRVVRLTDDST